MINNISEVIISISKVIRALESLDLETVFTGGSVVSFYADDPGAEMPRPTKDIDIVFEIATFAELTRIQQKLLKLGFVPKELTCRYSYDGILIDVMGIKAESGAPANSWFEPGIKVVETIKITDNLSINMFSVSYFIASKLETFHNPKREYSNNMRMSQDFEDIIYMLNNRTTIVEDIVSSPEDVREFLKKEFTILLNDQDLNEGIQSHLEPFGRDERLSIIKDRLKKITVESF